MTMPPSERRHRRSEEHLTDAELNELVDGTLAAQDVAHAEEHLASCADCDERYRTLQATILMLRSAPSVMPRRSFQLTPEQAKIPAKAPSWLDRFSEWIVPGVPAIRAATLAVALLLLSVTAIDVLTHRNGTTEQAGPAVMRQAEPTQPAAPAQANQRVTTAIPAEQETGSGVTSVEQPGGAADSAAAQTETSGPMVSSALQSSDTSETDSAAAPDQTEENMGAEIPPPAAAMPQEEPSQMPASMAEVAPEASLTVAASESATPSPVPATPPAAATATPGEHADGNTMTVSRWRIAEFGLLLLLVWLGVTWFGRTRVGDRSATDETDSEA